MDPMLLHSTYFNLKEKNSQENVEKFMAIARKYLSSSDGLISFWIGQRAKDMKRPENDLDYDIAMHQIFRNKAAFDHYNGSDPDHDQFVVEVNQLAPDTTRRVLDVYVYRLIEGGNPSKPQSVGPDGNLPQHMFHNIYFELKYTAADAIRKFEEICLKYLSKHPGISQFIVGELADLKRSVSVNNYNVAVSIVYESKEAYDAYLKSKEHDEFFPATEGMITHTYIFDSYPRYQCNVFSLTR